MGTILNPYLNFRGTARQAMEFYQSVFGGQLDVNTFGDFGMSVEPAEKDLIMHAMLRTDNGLALMGADVPAHMELTPGSTMSISLSGEDDSELRGYWEKISADGTVLEQLAQAPWGDSFGMCLDKFGVRWLVNIAGAKS